MDLDKWIEKVKQSEYLPEEELKALCEYVSSLCHTLEACTCVQEKMISTSEDFEPTIYAHTYAD